MIKIYNPPCIVNRENLHKRVAEAFYRNFEEGLEVGAGVAVYYQGKEILSLHEGWFDEGKIQKWQPNTLVMLCSAGKAVASAALLHALQEKKIPLETRVSTLWPQFAASGKENITILQILSHSAGLSALDTHGLALTDHEGVTQALAAQAPNWKYDGTHGYSAFTFGFLVDELLRRCMEGEPLAAYWRRVFADPLGLNLWFGIPKKELPHATSIIHSKQPIPINNFARAGRDRTSLTYRSFTEPGGGSFLQKMNDPEIKQTSLISLGAMSTTNALARFYSLIATQKPNDFFTEATLKRMRTPVVRGMDRVNMTETAFSAGFMMHASNPFMGPSRNVFGHLGNGGILGFADSENEIAFAYLCNLMHRDTLTSIPLPTQRLVKALYTN